MRTGLWCIVCLGSGRQSAPKLSHEVSLGREFPVAYLYLLIVGAQGYLSQIPSRAVIGIGPVRSVAGDPGSMPESESNLQIIHLFPITMADPAEPTATPSVGEP